MLLAVQVPLLLGAHSAERSKESCNNFWPQLFVWSSSKREEGFSKGSFWVVILIEKINAGKQKDIGSPPLTYYHWDTAKLHYLHFANVHSSRKEVHKEVSTCQHGFVKSRSSETILISFHDSISGFVVKGETRHEMYLGFSVSFCTVSHGTQRQTSAMLSRANWWKLAHGAWVNHP